MPSGTNMPRHNSISRRSFLSGAAATALAGTAALARTPPSQHPSNHEPSEPLQNSELLQELPYGAVQLTGGPLKAQYDRVHASYLALDNDRLLKVYRERAGLPAPGKPMGGWYGPKGFVPGHSLGQYISGLARIGRTTGDTNCQEKVAELVHGFAATMGPKDQVFAAPNASNLWPCYILDKHLAGLMDACQLSGVHQARELLPRVYHGALPYIPDHVHDRIGKSKPPYDEPYILPESLFAAWQITGDRAMYRRAVTYLLNRDFFDPLARNQNVFPGKHAYSHAMALSSAAKARLVLGEEKYLATLRNGSRFLRTTQQYASGGWGPNELFVEPHQGKLYESLITTHDHFETPCGTYAATKLARYLLRATGEARYADDLERVVFNALLMVKEPDSNGDYFYYSNYAADADKTYYPQKWPCCSGTLVEGVADYVKNIYFRSPRGLAVALYAPSRVRFTHHGAQVTVEQHTAYPLSEKVTLTVTTSAPATFSLQMRLPRWLTQPPTLLLNGKPAAYATQLGFAVLHRTWRTGDTVTLHMPQTFHTEPIDDLHPNTVALMRGPLMYVEINPAPGPTKLGPAQLAQLDKLRSIRGSAGLFCQNAAGRMRVHSPIYFIRNESYTSYFEKA